MKIRKIVLLILVLLLLLPIPMQLKDGGTVKYQGLLYSISDVHRLDHNSESGYQDGWIIEVLGLEMFNNVD